MKNVSFLCTCFLIALTVLACAPQVRGDDDDGPGSPPPECGDGVCQPGESHESCPDDCDNTAVACNNNGTCDSGESTSTCQADCPGIQFYPPDNYSQQVCYFWLEAGKLYISCDPQYMRYEQMVKFIGGSQALNLCDYWTKGHYMSVTHSQAPHQTHPWYTARLNDTPAGTAGEMTYGVGSNTTNTSDWAQYFQVPAANALLRECGPRQTNPGGGTACGIFWKSRGPGKLPEKLGYYPPAPPYTCS